MNKTWRKITATIAAILLGGSALTGAAYLPVITASPVETGVHTLADAMGVTVKRVDGLLLCGTTPAKGCFYSPTPDTVYVVAGLDADVEAYAVAHELGHVLQHRLGQPQSECDAEVFAQTFAPGFSGTYAC